MYIIVYHSRKLKNQGLRPRRMALAGYYGMAAARRLLVGGTRSLKTNAGVTSARFRKGASACGVVKLRGGK